MPNVRMRVSAKPKTRSAPRGLSPSLAREERLPLSPPRDGGCPRRSPPRERYRRARGRNRFESSTRLRDSSYLRGPFGTLTCTSIDCSFELLDCGQDLVDCRAATEEHRFLHRCVVTPPKFESGAQRRGKRASTHSAQLSRSCSTRRFRLVTLPAAAGASAPPRPR